MTDIRIECCPYCPESFIDSERYSARDYLDDHLAEAHQDKLRKLHEGGV